MSSNTNLGNTPVSQGFSQLYHTGETGGLTSTLQQVFDGDGTGSDLYLATNKVKIGTAGNFLIGSNTIQEYIQDIVGDMFDTNGSHTNVTATYDDAGDGAIDLNATGAISALTEGTGVTITGTANKTIAIGQSVGTSDSVSFGRVNLGSTDTSSFLTGDPKISATGYMMIQGIINETETGSSPAGIVFGNNSTYGNDEISLITAGQNRLFINSSGNITISQDLTISGDLQVNGTTTTINQTNLDVSDNIIGLNRGLTGASANDSGLIIERGTTGDNIFIGYDESLGTSGRVRFATTTALPNATGALSFSGDANVHAGRFYGDVTGNVTGSASLNLLISSNLSDLNNASTARTNLGVDPAGTDNSTPVTLAGSRNYITAGGTDNQTLTLGQIDISDDTNLVGGTGITLTGDTLSTTDSEIVHDNLNGYVANEHKDHSAINITTGATSGLSGGGNITATRSLSLNVNNLDAQVPALELADKIAIYDNSEGENNVATLTQLKAIVNTDTDTNQLTTFNLAGDSGSSQSIAHGNTLTIQGGSGIATATSATDDITINYTTTGLTLDTTPQDEDEIVYQEAVGGAIKKTRIGSLANNAVTSYSNTGNDRVLTSGGGTTINGESELTYNGAGQLEINRSGSNAILQLRSDTNNTRIHFKENTDVAWNIGYDATNNWFSFYDASVPATPIKIKDGAGSDTFVVDSNSRVGIGTASPSYLLHLSGTAPELAFTDTDGSATWRTRAVANNFHITETGAGDPFVISSGAGANAITIMSTGNVSIGGATASRDLQVNGDGVIRVLNDSGDSGIDFNASDMQIRYRSASDKLQFYSYGTSTNVATIQKSDGFLGLGTESPTSLLTTSGGDIRILGSGNRLRFNTNGSIYWDNSIGIKLENASTENITIETNTSGDIFFNTGNTRAMSIQTDNKVFVGSNVQNQSLVLGGTNETYQYLDTRDYMQHKGHFAESDWIVMESGANHVVTSYFDNTNVYVDGVYKGKIDSAFGQATISSADLSLGSVISADRAVIVHQSGTIRSMCMSTRFSGRLLGSGTTRGYPINIKIYAPYSSVSYSIYRSSSANVDLSATALTTGTISQGGIITFTESDTASGTQHYVIEADGKVCATLNDGANDHLLFTPLSMEVIASVYSREIRGGVTEGLAETSTSILETANSNAYYLKDTSGKYGLFACGIADGAGGDAEFAMPIEFCSDYYIFGDPELSHYRLVCFQDTFVKVLDASGNVLYTHDASSATKHAPIYAQNGTATGVGTLSTAGPFRFVGTAPFQLVCQEPGGQDECTMLGAMQHELSNNQRFKGGAVPNDLVLPSDNQKLIIGANSDLELYAHDPANDSRINVNNNNLLLTYNGADRFRLASGGLVINEGGGDYNFRVEGDTDANLLFVDAGTDRVGIGGTPSQKLDIQDGQLTFTQSALNQAISGRIRFNEYSSDSSVSGAYIQYNGASNYLQMFTNTETTDYEFLRALRGSHLALQPSGGNVLIGGTSASGHGFNLEVLNDHAYVKGPDGWNGTGDKAIVALGSGVSNESFGCGYVYGTGLVLSTYKLSGGGDFGSSTQNSLEIADTTGQASFINDVVAFATSDKRLKENVKPLDSALDKIKKINGVEFDWIDGKDEHGNSVHSNEGHDIGVIAQEIEEVLPEVVTTRDNGYKAVKYEKIVPLLIQAIKEQQKQIEELKNG